MVDMLDALDAGVLAQRGGVEAHRADRREARLEPGQRLERGGGADRLVLGQQRQAGDVAHRHHRAREAALGACRRRALVRAQRPGVELGAVETLYRRDQVGADALRHEAELVVDARVHEPRATVAAHRPATHALDAAGDDQVLPAAPDLGRGEVDRLEPRSAEAAVREAGHRLRPVGVEHRGARDVAALLADRRHAAEHDVVDQRSVERVTLLQGVQQRAQQPHRRGLVQRAVLLALAARRAQVVVDPGFGHRRDSVGGGAWPLGRRAASCARTLSLIRRSSASVASM